MIVIRHGGSFIFCFLLLQTIFSFFFILETMSKEIYFFDNGLVYYLSKDIGKMTKDEQVEYMQKLIGTLDAYNWMLLKKIIQPSRLLAANTCDSVEMPSKRCRKSVIGGSNAETFSLTEESSSSSSSSIITTVISKFLGMTKTITPQYFIYV